MNLPAVRTECFVTIPHGGALGYPKRDLGSEKFYQSLGPAEAEHLSHRNSGGQS
ncbi:MAG: hypothetical protein DKINENOH_02315 [bacterium]|nr:hypothetical protein [bacterium]